MSDKATVWLVSQFHDFVASSVLSGVEGKGNQIDVLWFEEVAHYGALYDAADIGQTRSSFLRDTHREAWKQKCLLPMQRETLTISFNYYL